MVWTGDADVHACGGTAQQIRVGHVVGRVTEVGDGLVLQVVDAASVLGDGLEVGENLAGMEVIGQGVDHRMGGVLGHFFDAALAEGAPHHTVSHAVEHTSGIGHGLATAQLGAGLVDDQRVAAKLGNADGEAGTGAGGGLVEQYSDGLRTGERLLVEAVVVELDGKFEHLLLFLMVEVVVTQHVAKFWGHDDLLGSVGRQ